nr:hypothetical protein [Armatimonas sp.]
MKQTWKNGLPSSPDYFPLGVWLQSPENAGRYAAAGINLYVALWQGPTEKQLAALKAVKRRFVVTFVNWVSRLSTRPYHGRHGWRFIYGYVRIATILSLDLFPAQPIWEMSD